MTQRAQQRWLSAMWLNVRAYLPPVPATIVEVGCGRLGGFVPMLRDAGYDAQGIDPVAPEGEGYQQLEFERADLAGEVDAVIASASLHHVAEPEVVLDKIAAALAPAGLLVVIEWDWEGFDEATAQWCFDRLASTETDGWLAHHRERWAGSGQAWDEYLRAWADGHGIHSVRGLLGDLDRRFDRVDCERGPYCFEGLPEISEAEERKAIEAGTIRAMRIDYVGRAR